MIEFNSGFNLKISMIKPNSEKYRYVLLPDIMLNTTSLLYTYDYCKLNNRNIRTVLRATNN